MGQYRLQIFLVALVVFMFWQLRKPFTGLVAFPKRLLINFSMIGCSWGLIYVVTLLVPLQGAYWNQYSLNLLDVFALNDPIKWIASLVVLDFVIYWQHRLLHEVPFLWRLHKAHHTDPQLDTSSAVRFHPFEIIFSMLIKTGAVLVFGIPISALIVFEIILNAVALFHHSNIEIPSNLENQLRNFMVTPDLHRVHHSTVVDETNSNYCFTTVLWDKLFGTHKARSKNKLHEMKIGLDEYEDIQQQSFLYLLKTPFHDFSKAEKS